MKPRHAAALVLVIWYLLILTDPEKPYWQGWSPVRVFQSEGDCKRVSYGLAEWGWNHSAVDRPGLYDQRERYTFPAWQLENAFCVKAQDIDSK